MPSEKLELVACWRATPPRPGSMRSSAPATLSMSGDVCTACSTLIEARNGSSPATVTRNWPSSRPFALSDRLPLPTAMVSPCCTRACVMSMRPPAACISRKRTGQGLGEKSFKPRSTRGDVGVERMRRGRMQGGRRRPRSRVTISMTG